MNEWLAARNILAVRLDNIGDVIMPGPSLRAVKETSPWARLTLLASPAGATAVTHPVERFGIVTRLLSRRGWLKGASACNV